MNRHERRKLSRHATPEEIFPGRHGPIQTDVRDTMNKLAQALKDIFPGFDFTLFVFKGDDEESRFNYISTAERADMVAVLKAFILKYEQEAAAIEKINDAPPTTTKQ